MIRDLPYFPGINPMLISRVWVTEAYWEHDIFHGRDAYHAERYWVWWGKPHRPHGRWFVSAKVHVRLVGKEYPMVRKARNNAEAYRIRDEIIGAIHQVGDPERIVAAAVVWGGVIYSLPRPARHHDVMQRIPKLGPNVQPEVDLQPANQGFITSSGRYVDRGEAAVLAIQAGQIERPRWGEMLYSEEVW